MKKEIIYDILIVGGGINGASIARNAAGRGYKVCLVEQNDLASSTSSASTKLIHGGLRYLEHFAFKMVRESLKERNLLMNLAPHVVWPIKFILPHFNTIRPKWIISLGLIIYDILGGGFTKILRSSKLELHKHKSGNILKKNIKHAYMYFDCWGDDSRIVVLNCISAREKGAKILTYTKLTSAILKNELWECRLKNSQKHFAIKSKILVNASGPFVNNVISKISLIKSKHKIRLIKGSHLIIKRKLSHDYNYILQNDDGRMVFLINYEKEFMLLGTTDVSTQITKITKPVISEEEIKYLLNAVSKYLAKPIKRSEILHSFSGYRPIYDKETVLAQKANRDYKIIEEKIKLNHIISIYGGKLTTFRILSEKVLKKVDKIFCKKTIKWTHLEPLPGGDFNPENFNNLICKIKNQISDIDDLHAKRIARCYGTLCFQWFENAKSFEQLGIHFGFGLTEKEVIYLVNFEFARTLEDVLLRRTKLMLNFNLKQKNKLNKYIKSII